MLTPTAAHESLLTGDGIGTDTPVHSGREVVAMGEVGRWLWCVALRVVGTWATWARLARSVLSQRKKKIWPFRCDFQAGTDGVGHINLGKTQFCFLLRSENAQGPPPRSLSPLSVRKSRVLKWMMWMPSPGQDSCVLAEVIPVQRTLYLLWDPQASRI